MLLPVLRVLFKVCLSLRYNDTSFWLVVCRHAHTSFPILIYYNNQDFNLHLIKRNTKINTQSIPIFMSTSCIVVKEAYYRGLIKWSNPNYAPYFVQYTKSFFCLSFWNSNSSITSSETYFSLLSSMISLTDLTRTSLSCSIKHKPTLSFFNFKQSYTASGTLGKHS